MKKLVIFSAAAAALLAASAEEAVKSAVSKMLPPTISASVSVHEQLPDGWASVKVNIKDPSGASVGEDLFFSNGTFVTPMLLAADGTDYKAEYKKAAEIAQQAAIKKALPAYLAAHKNYVRLGSHGGAASVVFTDPDCPFCRQHLKGLEEELKSHDVIMVLMPLPMHKNALNKAALLLDEVGKLGAKASTASKLAVFKKYFADGEFAAASEAAKKSLSQAADDAFALGVNYTPAVFADVAVK